MFAETKWASSWDYGTFRPPETHSSNAHAQPSSGARSLIFGQPFVYVHSSCVRTAKALARLRGCAGSPESSLVAYAISTIISWAGSNKPQHDKTNTMTCAQRRLRSAWAPAWSDQSSLCSIKSLRPKVFLCGQRRLWSDWADAQADLSLRWAHRSFCWFCHAPDPIALLNSIFLTLAQSTDPFRLNWTRFTTVLDTTADIFHGGFRWWHFFQADSDC